MSLYFSLHDEVVGKNKEEEAFTWHMRQLDTCDM